MSPDLQDGVARGRLQDLLEHDHVVAVFVDEQVVVLSELASAVVLAVAEEGFTQLSTIADALVAEFGEPPGEDLGDVTTRLVSELVQHGILRSSTGG